MPAGSRPDPVVELGLRQRLVARARRMQEHWVAHVVRRGLTRDLAAHTLALSAQQVLCTGPLLVAASAVMHRFGLGDALDLLANLFLLKPDSTRALAELMRATTHPSLQALLLSLGAAVFFGLSVASTIQRMLETMWGLDRLPLSGYWRQVVWILAVAPVMAIAMYAGHLTRLAPFADVTTVILMALALGIASMLFSWWTQYLLLGGRVEWRRLLPGSAFIGVGIAIAQAVSNAVVPGQLVEQSRTFGPIGAVFVLTSWVVAIVAVFCAGVLAGAVVDERETERVQRRRRRLGRPSVPAGRTLRGRRPRAGEAMVGGTPVDPTSPAGPDRTRDRRGGTS